MARTNNLSEFLTDVAKSIKDKKGITEKIPAANFDTEIASIKTGIDTSDATATAADIKSGSTAYAKDTKLTGTLTFDKFNPDYPNCLEKAKQIEGSVPLENPCFISGKSYKYRASIKNYLKGIPQLDTSNLTTMYDFFAYCENLETIPLLDTSKVTDMASMFWGCGNLTEIPLLDTSKVIDMYNMFRDCSSLTHIPQLNTSNVDDMRNMFWGCGNLTEIPLLDTSKTTGMSDIVINCTNLSDESLNNILQMCINAKIYGQSKTLEDIGLSREQATKCQSLSNWQAFLDAGWTSGY